MKFIPSIRNAVMFSAVEKCVTLWNENTALAEEPKLKPMFSHVEKRNVDFNDSIKSAKESVVLEEEDSARDTAFSKLMNVLRGYRDVPLAKKSEAASVLLEIMERHGGRQILSRPYDEETGLLSSIKTEFESEKALEMQKELDGVQELASEVFLHNDAVKALSVKKVQLTAQTKTIESATAIKRELVNYFNQQILSYLEVMQTIDSETYGDFAKAIFLAVKSANDSVQKKMQKKHK